MKKTKMFLTAIILVTSTWLAKGQSCSSSSCNVATCEYVCNGSFEYNIGNPTAQNQVTLSCGWINGNSGTTPDYYTTSGTYGYMLPCSANGSLAAHTGSAYVGFLASYLNGSSWVESVSAPLKTKLVLNKTYVITFWIALSTTSLYNTNNNVGIRFLDSYTPSNISAPITVNTSTNTTGWIQYSAVFTPTDPVYENNFDGINIGALTAYEPQTLYTTSPYDCVGATSPPLPHQHDTYYFLEDVSVKELITPTLTASSNSGCTGETFTLTATGANSYTWNPGSLTGASVAVTPTATTIYTVTGSTTGGCSVVTGTYTITTAACCANPNTGNINFRDVNLVPYLTSGATTWTTLTSGGYYTGNIAAPSGGIITKTLSIAGGFSINAAVTFSNCNIAISMDKAIVQYSTTIIDHSYLWGCDGLWAGIQTKAQLTITNSWIEDGYRAIETPGIVHPGIIVDNVLFNKNYWAIAAVNSPTIAPGNFKITGNLISCRSFGTANYTTTTRYNSLFPNPGAKVPAKIKGSTANSITNNTIRSDLGIYMAGTTSNTTNPTHFTIGDVSATASVNATYTNRFDYLNEGIVNLNSKVNIYNNGFSNITTVSTGTTLGAIYHACFFSHSTSTKVGALGGAIPTSSYKNVFGAGGSGTIQDGVTALYGGMLDVSYNDFSTISRYGVNVQTWNAASASTETVVVSNNSFSTTAYAFYAYNNQTITASVNSNTLVQTQPTYTNTGYGAYINEVNKPANTTYSVFANNFSGGLFSIYAVNTKNVRIVNNTVQVKKPSSTSIFNGGIILDNSDYNLVKGNNLSCTPSNSGSWNTFGVFANASYNNTVKCNSITAVSSCMKFQGACNPTTIYFNELNTNTSPVDPCLYGIWYDQGGQTGNIGYYNSTQWEMSDDKWGDFNYAGGGADTKCQTNSNTTGTCTIYYNTHGNAAVYQPAINLANGVFDLSQAYNTSTTSNTNSQNCGENARMINPLTGGNGKILNSGQSIPENAAFRNHNSTNNSLIVYTELEGNVILGPKRIILPTGGSNQRDINNNGSNFLLVDSLMTAYTQNKSLSVLNNARSVNAGINPANVVEQNQKAFNAIYCTYLEKDSLVTNAQVSDLQNLAWLCPFTDGLAIYNARGLVRHWDDSTRYFNACENVAPDLATDQARFAAHAQNSAMPVLPTVYPNPSNGTLMVNSNCKDCIFEVYDVVGKKVMSQKLSETETKVDLSSLNSGTYLYKISQNGTILKTDKLILNK